jgi:hypothetical protein
MQKDLLTELDYWCPKEYCHDLEPLFYCLLQIITSFGQECLPKDNDFFTTEFWESLATTQRTRANTSKSEFGQEKKNKKEGKRKPSNFTGVRLDRHGPDSVVRVYSVLYTLSIKG